MMRALGAVLQKTSRDEAYIARVEKDGPATITLDAYPDTSFRGAVRQVVPTADRQRATVQGGSLLRNLDRAAEPHGLATTAGNVSHTGVGGLTLGGGMGWLARQFGHKDGEGFADGRYLRGISHNIGYYVYRDESAAYRTEPDGTQHPYDSERAIIDTHPEVEGLFMSVAHVGHGIMTSPASGEILASKVLGLPLPNPLFSEFGLDAKWVEYDEGVL